METYNTNNTSMTSIVTKINYADHGFIGYYHDVIRNMYVHTRVNIFSDVIKLLIY